MKKLLIILTLGLMFGQAKVETRIYEIEHTFTVGVQYDFYWDNILDVTLEELDYEGVVNVFKIAQILGDGTSVLHFRDSGNHLLYQINYTAISTYHSQYGEQNIHKSLFLNNYDTEYFSITMDESAGGVTERTYIIKLAVTAEFPDMDTGYMEEDFDFCLHEGYNLVSYPCENDIAINDAVPSNISAYLESIVGEGIAGVNINGNWVGSLTELQSGSGYWFKSSVEACFNYECVENQ